MQKPILFFCSLLFINFYAFNQKVSIEDIKQQCSGVPYNQRVRLSVSSFDVSTVNNPGQFGGELAQMLTNALQNVNCFNVLLSLKDIKAVTDESAFEQQGYTDAAANNQVKMKSAQVIVMGKVTEFSSGVKKFQIAGIGASGGNKAHVGFVIQLINAATREIIDSKSINVDGKTGGFSGAQMFGVNLGGGTNNKSLQNACEQGVIQAVEFIASKKDEMPLPEGNSGVAAVKTYNATNCAVLGSSYIPKIMVILPEYHITRRIPDPAGETEINRKLVEAGFRVVDPAMYAAIEQTAQFADAAKDPMKAISIGKKFGADIVIYGEAFSQLAGLAGSNQISATTSSNQVSCRARVEVRAVRTDDATIIATNGLEAGAVDNAEFVAAKSALRSAGTLVANYLLDQFCTKNLTFSKSGASSSTAASASDKPTTEITLLNADYGKLKMLADLLATKGKVVDKSLSEGKGYIKIEHTGTTDALADFISSNKAASAFSIGDVSSGKMTISAK